jgi:hypothetical protein
VKRSDAMTVVAKLNAAWGERMSEATLTVYVERVELLENPAAAMVAVNLMIDGGGEFVPPVGRIIGEYRAVMQRPEFKPGELSEPELTEEQRRENVARMRALAEQVTGSIKPVG